MGAKNEANRRLRQIPPGGEKEKQTGGWGITRNRDLDSERFIERAGGTEYAEKEEMTQVKMSGGDGGVGGEADCKTKRRRQLSH